MAEKIALKIGLALPLSNGAKVLGVLSEDRSCTCFELTAPDGIVTRLALTDEALEAMVDIRTELLLKDAAYGNACARAALVALGRNAGVRMSVLRGKACTCGALGTGSAAGRTTAEFSSLRTQAHGYGVPGTHEGEQHG